MRGRRRLALRRMLRADLKDAGVGRLLIEEALDVVLGRFLKFFLAYFYGREALVAIETLIDVSAILLHDVFYGELGEALLLSGFIVGIDEHDERVVALHHDAFAHERHCAEHAFHLFGIDVLTIGREKHVFASALDNKVILGVEKSEVAGVEPSLLVDYGSRGLGIIVITEHKVVAAHENLAYLQMWIGAVDAYFHA